MDCDWFMRCKLLKRSGCVSLSLNSSGRCGSRSCISQTSDGILPHCIRPPGRLKRQESKSRSPFAHCWDILQEELVVDVGVRSLSITDSCTPELTQTVPYFYWIHWRRGS
ncbi:unnamed protein product [Acanthoscelides obtectus]|uniref:Uncharacterized protein n=1 Tax=Acanthoscelides obtectus TaxID=200917 RepID=A0A9P0K4T3_ACAOB|nr:unnamed protein product [Acanthoscelides obtectus]CAK1634238.1 hypothetical protein AOBTE_LOCUS8690 [Acanthoscelides obtectus]